MRGRISHGGLGIGISSGQNKLGGKQTRRSGHKGSACSHENEGLQEIVLWEHVLNADPLEADASWEETSKCPLKTAEVPVTRGGGNVLSYS